MNLPDQKHLGEILDIFRVFQGGRGVDAAKTLPAGIDARIANALGIDEAPFTTSIEAAFALREHVFSGFGYVNVDLREYDDERGRVYICDIKTGSGESGGTANDRARAIVSAVVAYVTYEMESLGG